MQKVIGIVGPTAVGKTALSIQLAQQFNGEIISADSMQVYRHLDIGTAKITPEEMAGVPHHLINIRDVNERFSVADFVTAAHQAIDEITGRGHLPIIVGGTGFYLRALLEGLNLGGEVPVDGEARQTLQEKAQSLGDEALWQELQAVDPVAAARIPVNNVRRVIRALEVIQNTGHPFSEQVNQQPALAPFLIGLNTDRPLLYERINHRVDLMMRQGLLNEAEWLKAQDGEAYQAGKGIGYRELWPYLNGNSDLATAVDEIKKDSRHFAKRQLTWFRNQMTVHWYDLVQKPNEISDIRRDVLTFVK